MSWKWKGDEGEQPPREKSEREREISEEKGEI